MAEMHLYERISKQLAARMKQEIAALSSAMGGPGITPPFAVKLSDDELIQQFLMLEPDDIAQMVEERGVKAVMDYATGMWELIDRKYPNDGPKSVVFGIENNADEGWRPRPDDAAIGVSAVPQAMPDPEAALPPQMGPPPLPQQPAGPQPPQMPAPPSPMELVRAALTGQR